MKYPRRMPEDGFGVVSEGVHQFRVLEIFSEDVIRIVAKVEVIAGNDEGKTLLYSVSNEEEGQFFWLTKLFLKCLKLPHTGDIIMDTDEWIGREFSGEVKHKDGYANIKKLIEKEDDKI